MLNVFRIISTISISNGTSLSSCDFVESEIKPAYCSVQTVKMNTRKALRRAHLINLVSFKDFIIVSVMLNCKWWLAVRQCSFCYKICWNNRVLFQQFHNYGLSFLLDFNVVVVVFVVAFYSKPHVKWTSLMQPFNWCRAHSSLRNIENVSVY